MSEITSQQPWEDLPDNQRVAVLALARGEHKKAAAAKAGVTDRQLRRWRRQPAFAAAYRDEKQDAWHRATGVLHDSSHDIVMSLKALVDGAGSDHAKVRAIDVFLKWAFKSAQQEFVEDAVRDLYFEVTGAAAGPAEPPEAASTLENRTLADKADMRPRKRSPLPRSPYRRRSRLSTVRPPGSSKTGHSRTKADMRPRNRLPPTPVTRRAAHAGHYHRSGTGLETGATSNDQSFWRAPQRDPERGQAEEI